MRLNQLVPLAILEAIRRRDLWTEIALNPDEQLFRPCGLDWAALLPAHIHNGSGHFTCVKAEEGRLLGIVQARQRPSRDKWDVIHLSTLKTLPPEHQSQLCQSLLADLCQVAGQRGAGRLFAKMTADEANSSCFESVGFTPYATERVWQLAGEGTREVESELGAISGPPFAIRPQRPRDVWGIYQVYVETTPRGIQLVENLTSEDWDYPPVVSGWLRGWREQRLVLEVEGTISGLLRLESGARGYRLSLWLHPRGRPLAERFLAEGMALLPGQSTLPIYCPVPHYQEETESLLQRAGFVPIATQKLLVKQTVRRVRARQPILQPAFERALEPATKTHAVQSDTQP